MFRFVTFFFLAILFTHGTAAQDKAGPLTLDETLRHVYRENPTLEASRYGQSATKELYPQAVSGWHPRVDAETSLTSTHIESGNFSEGDGATTKSASVSVEQPIFRGFRTTSEIKSAEHRIDAGSDRVSGMAQDMFLRAVEAYMNVIRDRMLLDLQRKNVALLGEERESVGARFDAGDVTQTDVKQTDARYSKAQADDATAESDLRESEAVFEQITGLFPPLMMEMPVISFAFPQTAEELVVMAGQGNPELNRTRDEYLASESDIGIAESEFYPKVSAFASYLKEYDPQPGIVPESEVSTIGVRARINLYEGFNTVSRTREAKFRANQKRMEIRAAETAVKSDLITQWRRMQAFDAEISARELEITAARFSADGVREEARLGERTVLDLLEAEQDMLDAQSALVKARRDRIVTAYRLAAALGLLTPESLGFRPVQVAETAE
jgi:TolC family type I secretion outer membrane protein